MSLKVSRPKTSLINQKTKSISRHPLLFAFCCIHMKGLLLFNLNLSDKSKMLECHRISDQMQVIPKNQPFEFMLSCYLATYVPIDIASFSLFQYY